MSYRQKVLKAVYPVFMWLNKITGSKTTNLKKENAPAPVSFYSLRSELNNGNTFDFASLKGKKVLLVNTASDCGYTGQYDDLQKLFEEHKDQLIVLGFPANDFKEQEKGTDEEIAAFCRTNFHITFPLMKKSVVINDPAQNPVFKWLTDPNKNGWNSQEPTWNFSKYLVNEEGMLVNFFGPAVAPMSNEVVKEIKN
jgi:glutathione peroxidase